MVLQDFIICDDVRQEMGNKVSLMGVYEDAFVVDKSMTWPFVTRLSFFARIRLEAEPKPSKFAFKVLRAGDAKIKIEGVLGDPEPGKLINLILNLSPFVIKEPGVLSFELEFEIDSKVVKMPLRDLEVTGGSTFKSTSDPVTQFSELNIPLNPE